MEFILIIVVAVLILTVMGLLVWLIIANFAGRKEVAGQAHEMLGQTPVESEAVLNAFAQ